MFLNSRKYDPDKILIFYLSRIQDPGSGSATLEDFLFIIRSLMAIGCRREGESSRSKDPKAKLAGVIERLAFQTGDSVGIEIRHQNRITVQPFPSS
jgi:hypothetical protein